MGDGYPAGVSGMTARAGGGDGVTRSRIYPDFFRTNNTIPEKSFLYIRHPRHLRHPARPAGLLRVTYLIPNNVTPSPGPLVAVGPVAPLTFTSGVTK